MSSILWNIENAPLTLEIGRQSFLLPMSFYHLTTRKSLALYRGTLMNIPKMRLFGSGVPKLWTLLHMGFSIVKACSH